MRVLPAPAQAIMRTGPSSAVAASRCESSNPSKSASGEVTCEVLEVTCEVLDATCEVTCEVSGEEFIILLLQQ